MNSIKYPFTLISFQKGRCGYKEDDWQIIEHIYNDDDLYEALKEGYLTDARNRNDYPIVSSPIERIILNNLQHEPSHDYLGNIDDEGLEKDLRYEESDIDIKLLFNSKPYKNFLKWQNKLKNLLPRLREIKRENDNIVREKKKLFELAEKYGYRLWRK